MNGTDVAKIAAPFCFQRVIKLRECGYLPGFVPAAASCCKRRAQQGAAAAASSTVLLAQHWQIQKVQLFTEVVAVGAGVASISTNQAGPTASFARSAAKICPSD